MANNKSARTPDPAEAPRPIISVLHGPNLNMLGARDPEVYGKHTLAEIEHLARTRGEMLGLVAEFFQTNHEGELIDAVQDAAQNADGIVINPGALTHYSRALGDALDATSKPKVEVHLSNIYARDEWRRTSVTSPYVTAVIAGFSTMGYVFAMDSMAGFISSSRP